MVLTGRQKQAILGAVTTIEYRTAVRPAKLRCGLQIYHMIASYVMDTMTHRPMGLPSDYGYPRDGAALPLYGLELVSDRWIAPDAWRLTDEADTLLYDCRMGKP